MIHTWSIHDFMILMTILCCLQDAGGGTTAAGAEPGGQSSEMESSLSAVLRVARELRAQLQATSLAQSAELGGVTRQGIELMACVRNSSLASDTERLEDSAAKFSEHLEHVLEVSLFCQAANIKRLFKEGKKLIFALFQ
jgi:hypothetical protein